MPLLRKPATCTGCPLETIGAGYAPADGPAQAETLFVGESLGYTEALQGRPFIGDAGGMLARIFTLRGIQRSAVRIDNVARCRPPHDDLSTFPGAAVHCAAVHLADSLASPFLKVVVTLGNTALRSILQVSGKKATIENFHGTITREPHDRFWVVPTYHPSFLQRGAQNFLGTVLWDLQQAETARLTGKPADPGSLVIDPPLDWFEAWVRMVRPAIEQDPAAYPLSVDVETPDKAHGRDEGEITAEDRSFQILRVNLACHPDEGVTVPFVGPYLDLLKSLLAPPANLWLWNKAYDIPRLVAANTLDGGVDARALDLMWLWHFLQSDLPRGLGFVAPFYSTFGAWKHLADADPPRYGAIDGLQTHRVGFGVVGDLRRLGMYESARRHVHQLHYQALLPAQQVGVKIDLDRLLAFKAQLGEQATRLLNDLQGLVPDRLRPLTPKGGLTKRPPENVLHVKATAFTRKGKKRAGREASEVKLDLYKQSVVVERTVEKDVWVCHTCGAEQVQRRHRCPPGPPQGADDAPGDCGRDAGPGTRNVAGPRSPDLSLERRSVSRWFWQEPFNPDSWQQVLDYIKFRKHTPGRAKSTGKDTTNRETIERLTKTGDPFYARLLDYRAVIKVKGTYVDGTERRLDHEQRVHPEPTFKPSTMRLSYVNPNITNVIQDKDREGRPSLAAGFRSCVVASPGSRLLEVDFAGSEAVDVGWLCRDPGYIRLAKLGVHAGLASHLLGTPYDPHQSDQELAAFFRSIKKSDDPHVRMTYDRSKRFIHGFSYGLSIPGMVLQFPEIFPSQKVATEYADLFRHMAPAVPRWQQQMRELAAKQHFLGGPGAHPFGYKHWFWSVYTYKKITASQYWAVLHKWKATGRDEADCPVTVINGQYFKIGLGEDGKRCVAFMPQSITAGKLKSVMLRLFDPESPTYIGTAWFGKTPLRAPIHDSLLLEIPTRTFELVASIVCNEMQKPIAELPCPAEWGIGPYLSTGVSAKTGLDWQHMEDLPLASLAPVGAAGDRITTAAEPEEQEDVDDFGREVA